MPAGTPGVAIGVAWIGLPMEGMYAGGVVRGSPCGAGEGAAVVMPGGCDGACQLPGGWCGGGPAASAAGRSGAGKAGGGALGRAAAILSRSVCMLWTRVESDPIDSVTESTLWVKASVPWLLRLSSSCTSLS